jgi:hypothetical protein
MGVISSAASKPQVVAVDAALPLGIALRRFLLDPDFPSEGKELLPYMEAKFGGKAPQLMERVREAGAPAGAAFADWRWRSNTLRGHCLVALARKEGKGHEAAGLLFSKMCAGVAEALSGRRAPAFGGLGWRGRHAAGAHRAHSGRSVHARVPPDRLSTAAAALPLHSPPLCSYEGGANISGEAPVLEVARELGLPGAEERLGGDALDGGLLAEVWADIEDAHQQ